jgi:hypothetical protein
MLLADPPTSGQVASDETAPAPSGLAAMMDG